MDQNEGPVVFRSELVQEDPRASVKTQQRAVMRAARNTYFDAMVFIICPAPEKFDRCGVLSLFHRTRRENQLKMAKQ